MHRTVGPLFLVKSHLWQLATTMNTPENVLSQCCSSTAHVAPYLWQVSIKFIDLIPCFVSISHLRYSMPWFIYHTFAIACLGLYITPWLTPFDHRKARFTRLLYPLPWNCVIYASVLLLEKATHCCSKYLVRYSLWLGLWTHCVHPIDTYRPCIYVVYIYIFYCVYN